MVLYFNSGLSSMFSKLMAVAVPYQTEQRDGDVMPSLPCLS